MLSRNISVSRVTYRTNRLREAYSSNRKEIKLSSISVKKQLSLMNGKLTLLINFVLSWEIN